MSQTNHLHKAIIVISSHVARGSVGNRAAVFALETLSFPVWAVPTIILPWHPGHGPATRIVPGEEEFSSFMHDLENANWVSEVGAVLTGYMANAEQAIKIAKLVKSLKAKNPDLVCLCDPVIGDIGGLYVPEETASAIREHLLPIADVASPNRFELGWLCGKHTPRSTWETLAMAKTLGPENVLVTSCPGETTDVTGNLLVTPDGNWFASHNTLDNPPNGPGDLTAAIHLGHRLKGLSPAQNLERTTSSVLEILNQSTARGSDELTLESDSRSILDPKILIGASRLKP